VNILIREINTRIILGISSGRMRPADHCLLTRSLLPDNGNWSCVL